jgi:Zn-dependent protease
MGNDILQLSWSLLFILAVFACIFLHELGHALVARSFGIEARNIVLLPIGGIASIEKFPDNPRQELAISAAGPAVNLAIAGIIWLLLPEGATLGGSPFRYGASVGTTSLADLGTVNLVLALFNLIPAFPMDGGRILRALLGLRLNYIQATSIAATIGKAFAILFIAAGIVFINLWLPLIGIFIFIAAGTEEYYLRIKSLATGVRLSEVVMYEYSGLQTTQQVQQAAPVLLSNHSKYFLLMENNMPVGVLNRLLIIEAIAENQFQATLGSLPYEKVDTLQADQPVEAVLEKLAGNEDRIFPVVEQGRFVGVVSMRHIIEYLLVHKTGTPDYKRLKSLVTLLH